MNDELIVIATLVPIITAVMVAVVQWLMFGRTKRMDLLDEGKQTAQITSDMGVVKEGIQGINRHLERQDEKTIILSEKMSKIDTEVKSAHKRIDRLDEVIDHERKN